MPQTASGCVILARLPRLPCQPPFMLRENSKTRRALWRVDGKAEDVGLPAQVKDDRACVPLSADAMIVINEIRKNSK